MNWDDLFDLFEAILDILGMILTSSHFWVGFTGLLIGIVVGIFI